MPRWRGAAVLAAALLASCATSSPAPKADPLRSLRYVDLTDDFAAAFDAVERLGSDNSVQSNMRWLQSTWEKKKRKKEGRKRSPTVRRAMDRGGW